MQRADSFEKTWCWERLKVGGKGGDIGWDDWVASPNQWTWVWVDSGSWWWTGRSGVLQSMGLQRVGHNWATELNCFTKIFHVHVHAQSSLTLCNPMDRAHQASLHMEFPRQENFQYWSGLPFPSPGDLPDPGIEFSSRALVGSFFTDELSGKQRSYMNN